MKPQSTIDGTGLTRNFTRTYVFALAVIAACALLTFFSSRWVLERERYQARLVNLSGRQRMFSQRIAFASAVLSSDIDSTRREEAKQILKDTVELFDIFHSALAHGSYYHGVSPQKSDELLSLYFSADSELDRHVKDLIADAHLLLMLDSSDPKTKLVCERIARTASDTVLPRLERVVAQHQTESESLVKLGLWLEHIFILLTLSALWIEAKFVFAPMATRVSKHTASLQSQTESSQHAAHHDPLTELPNRRYLSKVVSDLSANAVDQYVGIVNVDLDGFKQVNDTLGHKAGDVVLQQVAIRMRSALGSEEFVARVGGDEFVILHPNAKCTEGLVITAEKLLATLTHPIKHNKHVCRIGCSIGIAFEQIQSDGLEAALVDADLAMYEAKRRGGNQWVIIDEEVRRQHGFRTRAATDISTAIESEQFEPYFQPIVESANGKVIGVEALVRWDSQDGLLPPSEFLSVAESLGLIGEIDEMVLRKSLSYVSEWRRQGHSFPRLFLNLSMKSLLNSSFENSLHQMVVDSSLSVDDVCLEISDTLLNSALNQATLQKLENTLRKLHHSGFQIALDIGGLGSTSIHNLANPWIGCIKIDRSLVAGIDRDLSLKTTTKTLVRMAKALELGVIAEGVETLEESRFLQELGCVHHQGYLYSKPVSHDELLSVLENTGSSVGVEAANES